MFKFDITDKVIILFIGLLIGVILFFLILLVLSIRYKNELKTYGPKTDDPISDEELTLMIKNKIKAFKHKEDEEISNIKFMTILVKQLVDEVSGRYYPNSKYPMFELTVDELIQLNLHITTRVEDILSHKILGFSILSKVKKMRISDILQKMEESKQKKELEAQKTGLFNAMKKVTSKINPLRMIKEAGIEKAIGYVCVKLIQIAGVESQRIYSKQLFGIEEINLDFDEDYEDEVTE